MATNEAPLWHKQLAADFFQCHFLFIGTRLNEPTLYAQIQNYQSKIKAGSPRSYVLTPTATDIEKEDLLSANLEHISGSLADFCSWLHSEVPTPPSPLDLAYNNIPTLKSLLTKTTQRSKADYAELMQSVTPVSRSVLERTAQEKNSGTIRSFYRGFKPSWRDILDGVPARLHQFEEHVKALRNPAQLKGSGVVVYGPAGSGKSTFLRFAALDLADVGETVYEIAPGAEHVYEIIFELEKSSTKPYYVFLDRFDAVRDPLKKLWLERRITNGVIVAAESQRVWFNRVKANIGTFIQRELTLHEIAESDVEPMLQKIKEFGPWVRLQRLNEKQRKEELYRASKRQLLIGLLETTTGIGFDRIIENDYRAIDEEKDKTFLILVCLCTIHRASASRDLINRALVKLSIKESADIIAARLGGIVAQQGKFYSARHPVYARRVIESLIDLDKIYLVWYRNS